MPIAELSTSAQILITVPLLLIAAAVIALVTRDILRENRDEFAESKESAQDLVFDEISGPVGAGVSVIARRGRRVLVGRRKGSHAEGQWALPGGKIEPGETLIQTAKRELLEETGLEGKDFFVAPFVTNDRFPDDDAHYLVAYVVCDCPGEPELREPDKCSEWRFAPWFRVPSPQMSGLVKIRRQYRELIDLEAKDGIDPEAI